LLGIVIPVHAIKAYRELEEYVHSFLTSALYEGELPASRLGCFTQRKSLKCTLNKRGRKLRSQWGILGENNSCCAYLERQHKIENPVTKSEYRLSQSGSPGFVSHLAEGFEEWLGCENRKCSGADTQFRRTESGIQTQDVAVCGSEKLYTY
jgi:hypothetical protein